MSTSSGLEMWPRMLCAIVVCLLLSAGVSAQTDTRYGFKIGLSVSNVTDDMEDVYGKSEKKYGVSVGGSALIFFWGSVYIQPEILLVQRGANDAEHADYGLRLSYIDIPVLLKLRLPDHYRVCPGIFVGPAVNLLTGTSAEYGDEHRDVDENITNFDFSLIVGAGVDIGSGEGAFTLEGRYIVGFESIDDRRGEPADIRNRSFSVMAGYLF